MYFIYKSNFTRTYQYKMRTAIISSLLFAGLVAFYPVNLRNNYKRKCNFQRKSNSQLIFEINDSECIESLTRKFENVPSNKKYHFIIKIRENFKISLSMTRKLIQFAKNQKNSIETIVIFLREKPSRYLIYMAKLLNIELVNFSD